MAYEPRTFQAVTTNTPPTGTDPMVDNTANGDVQAIKILDGTAGSTTPLAGQKARAVSLSTTLSTEDIAALTPPAAITGYATSANQTTQITAEQAILAKLLAAPATEAKQDAEAILIGGVTEAAPGTDTASSGLNGRLQRIAQRLTSLITALGSPFQAGGSIGNTTFASTQSGTWTVQPGNTANTTAWLIDARGNVASGAADSGNPVKVGGRYNSTPPTLTDGQRGDMQLDVSGNLKINLATRLDSTNDSVNVGKWFGDTPMKEFTIAASAVRAATVSFDIVKPQGATGLHIWFDVTSNNGADTVQLSLVGRDATTTSKTKTLWSGPGAISTVTTGYYGIGNGISGGNMSSVTGCSLPLNVRVTITH